MYMFQIYSHKTQVKYVRNFQILKKRMARILLDYHRVTFFREDTTELNMGIGLPERWPPASTGDVITVFFFFFFCFGYCQIIDNIGDKIVKRNEK